MKKLLISKTIIFIIIIIVFVFLLIFIPKLYLEFKYGKFVNVSNLSIPRSGHKSILIDDNILTYGGGYFDHSTDKTTSIEIYNTKTKQSILRKDITDMLQIKGLDAVQKWQNYLIILQTRHIPRNSSKVIFYNYQTNKIDKIYSPKYSDDFYKFSVLNNGDILLYSTGLVNIAEKYSFSKNTSQKIILPEAIRKMNYHTLITFPVENDNLLFVYKGNLYLYNGQKNKFNFIKKIQLKINDFSGLNQVGEIKPKYFLLNNNRIALFSYDKTEHKNQISIYEIDTNNHAMNEIQYFQTNKIKYALSSASIHSLNNGDEILFIGGVTGIPSFFYFYKKDIYIYDINQNKIYKVAMLREHGRGYTSVVKNNNEIYIMGGFYKKKTTQIDLLEIKHKEK